MTTGREILLGVLPSDINRYISNVCGESDSFLLLSTCVKIVSFSKYNMAD